MITILGELFFLFSVHEKVNKKNMLIKYFIISILSNLGKFCYENKVYNKKNEIVNVPAGKYTCTTVSPVREDNKKFKNKAELDIMFSESVQRHPVKIRLRLKYGYLILKLSQIVN